MKFGLSFPLCYKNVNKKEDNDNNHIIKCHMFFESQAQVDFNDPEDKEEDKEEEVEEDIEDNK